MTPPHFSVLILSHNKWPMVCQAINSVISQTYKRWDITIVDSGSLMDKLEEEYGTLYPRFGAVYPLTIQESKEPPGLKERGINPCAWVLNQWFPKSEWSFVICDDDYLLPTYMEAFSRAIVANPGRHAFATGQIRGVSDDIGSLIRVTHAIYPGVELMPGMMDCKIDYLQFLHDQWLWEEVRKKHGTCYPIEMELSKHPDGIFMERAVSICPALPVPGIHCVNRRTPLSQFCGSGQ